MYWSEGTQGVPLPVAEWLPNKRSASSAKHGKSMARHGLHAGEPVSSSYNLTLPESGRTLTIYRDRIARRGVLRMMAAAAGSAGEAGSGLFETFRCAGDLLDQVRRGIWAVSGGHWRGGPGGRGLRSPERPRPRVARLRP